MRVLLLGGTGEARALARLLDGDDHLHVTSSLAGRVAHPVLPVGDVRVGGFGGADGLAAYLRAEGIDVVVDATHPFAARISANAATACAATGVPMLGLRRPGFTHHDGDRWVRVPTLADAARVLPDLGRRALLTTGRQEVGAFAQVEGVWFLVRAIDPPDVLPPDAELLLARGPFTLDDEVALMRERGIDVVVTKDSGGAMTSAKLDAARTLGLPVVVVDRPPYPDVPTVATPADAAAWLRTRT